MKYTLGKFIRSLGHLVVLVLCTMAFIATAAWQEPGVVDPAIPANNTIADYQPNHILSINQSKNYPTLPLFTFSIGAQQPILSSLAGASAFSPFLSLVVGNFIKQVPGGSYIFPEATYVEGMKIETGNIVAKSRDDYAGSIAVVVPGRITADIHTYPGDTALSTDVLHLDSANGSASNAQENDMVNILLQNNKLDFNLNTQDYVQAAAITTNRFGIEKNTIGGGFASLRMGDVSVDRVSLGGVSSNFYKNYIGNATTLPNPGLVGISIPNPQMLDGALSTTNVQFSNLGYGDYCYLQNPTSGGKCPDGFFLSKYDGAQEAICRSVSPAANGGSAIDVLDPFNGNVFSPAAWAQYYAANASTNCKQTPPKAICEDGIDNDHDGDTDYQADLGCESAKDMTEYNTAPPATIPDNRVVTSRLEGPYPIGSCNLEGSRPQFSEKIATFFLTNSFSGAPTPWPVLSNNSYYTNLPSVNGVNSIRYQIDFNTNYNPSFQPAKGDVLLNSGKYGTWLGATNQLHYQGPIEPGWYFIWRTHKMVKLAPPFILKVKDC